MNRITNFFSLFVFLVPISMMYSQVGINTNTPATTLDVQKATSGNIAEGIIAPRITGDELQAISGLYDLPQNGAILYITEAVSSPILGDPTSGIDNTGYYYYDSALVKWFALGQALEPWYGVKTDLGSTSNTEDIYQLGSVGIGTTLPEVSAQLDIHSNTKGALLPRLTKQDRDAVAAPAAGLLIYNTSTGCFNYYEQTAAKWLSICGTYDPASLSMNCASVVINGAYQQGTSLNSTNTIEMKVTVTEAGTYTILASSGNGYSFSNSGTYTETGDYTVVLEGQGVPSASGTDNISFAINGITVSCTETNDVLPSSVTYAADCASITGAVGVYQNQTLLGGSSGGTQYIDIPISVVAGGTANITTNSENSFYFTSGEVDITTATTSIRLYANGTPTNTGTFTFTVKTQGASPTTCTFDVTVVTSLGTWVNPSNSCYSILQEAPTSTDGLYFIKGNSNTATKTYCDMSNGGWTLVWSRSEKRDRDNASSGLATSNDPLNRDIQKGLNEAQATSEATANSSTVTWRDYRLPLAVMKNINTTSNSGEFKVRIVQDAANVFNNNDQWANDNYQIISTNGSGRNFFSSLYVANYGFNFTGKLWGATFDAVRTSSGSGDSNIRVSINGTQVASATPFGWYQGYPNTANDILNFGPGQLSNAAPITYSTPNGNVTVASNKINDLWSTYVETQLNHHWGKCGSTGDDYTGVSECYYTQMVPHSFNSGEGRILQWFVK